MFILKTWFNLVMMCSVIYQTIDGVGDLMLEHKLGVVVVVIH